MKRFHALLHRVEGWILALAILAMAAATIANVIARNATGDTLAATEELNQFLIVVVCFVGLAYAAGEGRHIRMTALTDAVPKGAQRALMVVVTGGTALLLFAFTWYAVQYVRSVNRTSPVLGVPLAWVYAIAPIGLLLGAIEYALACVRNLAGGHADVCFDPGAVEAAADDAAESIEGGL